jgi:FAD/FMN-containing dehydrogenase
VVAVAEGLPLDEAALAELESPFRGELVRRDDATYDAQRKVWNGSIDRRPALIARCAGVADVIASVRFCRRHGLPIAVRSGGHSFPGLSVADDACVIDLGLMKGVRVDPEARVARVQAGVLLGELDRETQAFGLAAPAGIVTHTGVAGLTLGGGIGWVMRKHGLSIDQLRRVDLVTADGELVRASADQNQDLFWGIRGGGGNFGIVTEFEFDLVPVGPTVLAGPIVWAMEDSPEVMRFYREWVADAPDELMTAVIHRKAPQVPYISGELHGKPVVMVVACWIGDLDDGERALRPMRDFGRPVADDCAPKAFVTHQAFFDPTFVPGRWYYVRSCDVAALTDDVIDTTVEHSLRISSPLTSFPIWQGGGAVARVREEDTAFAGRNAGFTYNIAASTASIEGFDEEREWVRSFWSALEPHFTGVYVNFLMDEGEDRVRQAYGPENYDRLRALKGKYDPENVFRLNQNIPPA